MSTTADGRRQLWLLAALAIVGVVYTAIATHLWIANWVSLVPIMDRSFLLRLMLGPFWVAIVLFPITIVATLLRLNIAAFLLTLLFYAIIINIEYLFMAQPNSTAMIAQATFVGWNFILQVPVWGLTVLALKLTRPRPEKTGAQGARL